MAVNHISTLFLTALALVWCQAQTAEIFMEGGEQVVKPGVMVQFTCRLVGFDDHSVLVNINKEVLVNLPAQPVQETIASSTTLNKLYRELERFSVTRNVVGNELIYTLTITGVKLEDSGWYSCSAYHSEFGDLFGRSQLEVYRPPNVKINLNDTYTITENETLPLECISEAVLPIPTMEFWITESDRPYISHHTEWTEMQPDPSGGQFRRIGDLIGRWRNRTDEQWRHVTKDFLIATKLNSRCAELPGSKTDCPLHYDYDMTAMRSEFRPNFRHDERQITCVAFMKHMGMDSANASVLLDVRYAPKIFCPGLILRKSIVKMNSTTHSISCRVLSNPPMDGEEDRSWSVAPCSESVDRIPNNSEEFNTKEILVSTDKKNRTLVLEWKKPVTSEYFKKSYCLRVRNEVGSNQEEFQLIESIDDLTQGGSSHTSSWSVLLGTALLLTVSILLNFSY